MAKGKGGNRRDVKKDDLAITLTRLSLKGVMTDGPITTDYSRLDSRAQVGGSMPVEHEIERRFTYHAPFGDQAARYVVLRAASKGLALLIARYCPPSRERELALTHLDQVSMWANASIARREYQPGDPVAAPVPAGAKP